MLGGTIGSRAIGTPENARARQYLIDQLKLYGFDVRVQEVDARRPELGRTAHVSNIVAVRGGARREALGLVAHYDSAPESPGASDDGFGAAVALEAARVLASRPDRRHSLMVLLTDGEEAGLMGAAGLVADRDVMDRLQAYIDLESIGSSGTAVLFQTGPGNAWIVRPWALSAPHPRGASYAMEIYRRLPNDTDFSIFERQGIPGLNFAPIGDSYAYHTARDTPDRIADRTLSRSGENVVSVATAMDGLDLGTRDDKEPTFFDASRAIAFTWGPAASTTVAVLALFAGILAWGKVTAVSIRLAGGWRWALSVVWAVAGVVFVAAVMLAVAWGLRESRTVYHPWYAHPDRLFLLLLFAGALAAWSAMRAGALLPQRAHGSRHPILVWSLTLPVWIALAAGAFWTAPAAAYLWTLPLLAAGVLLLFVPGEPAAAVRLVSVVVLAVAGTLWLRDTVDLLGFAVAVLGRMPIVSPVWIYPAMMIAAGVMIVPPFVATAAATRPLMRPSFITALLLVVVVICGASAYVAPAYTAAQPLRRAVRVLAEPNATSATWEVASTEPGLDLHVGAPSGWHRAADVPAGSIPWGRFHQPFVFRTMAPPPGPVPAVVTAFTIAPVTAGTSLSLTVMPHAPGLTVTFVLPAGVHPARSSLPGLTRGGRWMATYVAPPTGLDPLAGDGQPQGLVWRATFGPGRRDALAGTRVVVTSPRLGGPDWQQLPPWLPQDSTVWSASASWVLAPVPGIAPVPSLR